MGREKVEKSRKRHHSHHSRRDSSDDSSQSDSSSENSTDDGGSSCDASPKVKRRSLHSPKSADAHRAHDKHTSKGERDGQRKTPKKDKLKKRKKEVKKKSKSSSRKTSHTGDTISEEDYFLKSSEFRLWLSKERGVYFSELSSDKSRNLFKKFVEKWNKGLLKNRYYKGIQSSAVGHDSQTQYKWKFASKIDSSELQTMRDSVSEWTSNSHGDEGLDVTTASSSVNQEQPAIIGPSPATTSRLIGPTIGPVRPGPSEMESSHDREERREEEHVRERRERKEFRKQQELVLDELLPKATGREAKIEKKKARAEKRRARGYSPDLTDPSLMGPRDNIQARIRSIQNKRETKAHSAAQKISDYKAKEKARVEAILEMAKANKKEGSLW